MADNYSQDGGGGDWTSAASWTTGAAPIATEDVGMLSGAADFVTNLPTTGLDYNSLQVGPEFRGSIGSSGNVCELGSVPKVLFDGQRCKRAYFQVDNTETVSDFFVESTSESDDALVVSRNGTGVITRFRVRGGQKIVIAAAASVARLILEQTARIKRLKIESGADVDYAMLGEGVVDCYADIDNEMHINGGTWNHLGETNATCPLIIVSPGAVLNLWSGTGTFTNVYNFGMINANGGTGKRRTITNYFDCGGTLDKRGLGHHLTITNKFLSGGKILETT